MTYIMENVALVQNNTLIRTNCLIERKQISFLGPIVRNYRYMKMNVEPFIMTAPHVLFVPEIPVDHDIIVQREFFCNRLIKKGCTIFLTYVNINFQFEIQEKLEGLKNKLFNSPLDFAIGIKIPLRLLTVKLMRECKRKKIPAVFVVIEKAEQLEEMPWGWIKEAMFPHNCPLVPVFLEDKLSNEYKRTKMLWQSITSKHRIPSLLNELNERQPLTKLELAKIGVFPYKGSIHHGAEVSYNLYQYRGEINSFQEKAIFKGHQDKLMITVHKGTVIRAGEVVKFQPGYGEHLQFVKPSYFLIET